MSRFNGIGTWFLGIQQTDQPGIYTATSWFTFLFLPIFPLARYRIKPIHQRANHMTFQTLSREPLEPLEILRSYLFGWILIPLMVIIPSIFAVAEVQSAMGIPDDWQFVLQIAAVAWLAVFVWKLKDWDENRWRR